jgi:hypothetical protein
MRKSMLGAGLAGAVVVVAIGRRTARRTNLAGAVDAFRGGNRRDRWHAVTVNVEPERLGSLPPPLDELGETVEIVVRPAPGGRGTELLTRLVEPADRHAVRKLRLSLRKARALAEIGEVPLPDTPPTTKSTPLNAPLASATRHGREEGRL